ncbi:hypothetical protein VPH35_067061 [Triticum aestivum]
MTSVEIPLQGASAMLVMNGPFTFVDPVQPVQMRDPGGKKRDRCGDLLLADDPEAAGWSPISLFQSSFHRGCLIVTEGQNSRDQETAAAVVAEEILERQGGEKEPTVEELVYWTVI